MCCTTDKNPNNAEATERFQQIALAYESICAERQLSCQIYITEDFMYAAEEGDLDEIKSLLEADVDVFTTDRWGFTALHKAAQRGYWRIVAALLAHPSATTLVKMQIKLGGSTALHLASEKGHYRVIEAILNCCSVQEFLDMKDRHSNKTALQIAQSRYESTVKYGGDATNDQLIVNLILRYCN